MNPIPSIPRRRSNSSRHPRGPRGWKLVLGTAALLLLPDGRAQGGGIPGTEFGTTPRSAERLPIFFPPNPPPLGRAIARMGPPPGRLAAPPELAAYVNEPFYPPLGTQLFQKTLSAKLRAQLEQYRAARLALQTELRAELERVRDLAPTARATELTALARRQAPPLAALEQTAEDLRRALITPDNRWSALRQWRLGDNERRGFSPGEIAQVMRGYAFYHHGILPAQRRLLREIALELLNAADTTDNATAAQPYLFFPPEPARVLLPDDLPAALVAKVGLYQTKKSLLKKELYDAVYAYDGKTLTFLSGNSLKALADKQAAVLAQLETLAEEIRRDLAEVAEPSTLAERTPLPPVLQHRVATLMASYATLQKESVARIEAVLAAAKGLPMQTNYRLDGDSLKFLVVPTRAFGRGGSPPNPDTLAQIAEVRLQVSAIAEDYGQRIAELINEKDAIRAEIAPTLGATKAAAIDQALFTAMRVVTAKETEGLYRDYRIAVFQPGLSPEQRRLLFDGVMERLDLPLPRGELQPVDRASSW